ncbi:DUF4232 domain-containing protein [Phytoactinopolyspora endophytica]|uniref:DUF4232 domain-containing protein n=1 Tax=Phytoactinopolyspora endophytica TaxID=1642495 RepID=UPI00101DAE9C|nr:DUF4232 domain-containing protein [Phytoactinopolyspora endophytica]
MRDNAWRPTHPAPRTLSRTLVLIGLAGCTVAALSACGDAETSTEHRTSGAAAPDRAASPAPSDIAEQAGAEGVIDEVSITYVDDSGDEREAPPDDPNGWVARIDLMYEIRRLPPNHASELVAEFTADYAEPSTGPAMEIWLRPAADAEVAAQAFPLPADSVDPVADAYLMAETPGVMRSVFDGDTADVRVRESDDLAKVGDVAAAHGVALERVQTADGGLSLDIADVPARPEHVEPEKWPEDPDAPDCSPDDLWLEIAGHDAATGHRAMILGATNVGDRPCAFEGYPELGFRTLDGRDLDVTVTQGRSFMGNDPGPRRIVLPAGARAFAVAGWDAMSTAEYPEGSGNWPDITAEVLLAAESGAPMQELPLTSFTRTPASMHAISTLDIVDGGELAVTAWVPEGTAL